VEFPAPHEIAAGYDAVAADYAEEFGDELRAKPFDRELLAEFADVTVGRGLVADLGCGPGHVAAFLASRGVEMCGIDISTAMVAIARRRQPDTPFVAADLQAIPLGSAGLTGIVAFYSLIHLARDVVPRALAEVRRVLRPEGRLLLAVHTGAGEIHRHSWYDRSVNMAATLFDVEELHAAIAAAGLTVERSTTRPPYESEYASDRTYVLSRASS
jgi:SAM-dependent methyltransferase